MHDSLIVNLFGGPGAGKPSLAAGIFAELKWQNIDCEMAREHAKDEIWSDHLDVLQDQIYLFAMQNHIIRQLNQKVDVIVCDAPLLLTLVYNKGSGILNELVLETFKDYENLNIFVEREKDYNSLGRIHTEKEAKEIDRAVRHMLETHHILYISVIGAKASIPEIVKLIKKRLGGKYGE